MFVEGDQLSYCGQEESLKHATAVVTDKGCPDDSQRVPVIMSRLWVRYDGYTNIARGGETRPTRWLRTSCRLESAFPHRDPGDPEPLQPPRSKKTRIKTWQRHAFLSAHNKGFCHKADGTEVDYLDPTQIASKIALIHGELSEALEECARGRMGLWHSEGGKPEGFGIELADVFLRLAHLAETTGVDLEAMVVLKHQYNVTRPIRHGGKKL